MRITVLYGLGLAPPSEVLELKPGSSLADAIAASALAARVDPLRQLRVAIFGQLCDPAQVLEDGDRIELLRPLVVDAKEARRRRVAVRQRRGR